MKTPFCEFCLKTGILCKSCEERRNSCGFEIAKYLYDKFKNLNCELISIYEIKDYCILFMKGEIGPVIGSGGRAIREMSHISKRKIKIIDICSEREKIAEDLINPARLKEIREVYGKKEMLLVAIPKSDLARLPFDIGSIERILSDAFRKETKIAFE
jgi:transcription antitermination factor NusA-like protein